MINTEDTNMRNKFNIRDVAIYRYVWSLSKDERAKLNFCLDFWCTGKEYFYGLVDDSKPLRDYIGISPYKTYEVCYLDCDGSTINDNDIILISMRRHGKIMRVALVRLAPASEIASIKDNMKHIVSYKDVCYGQS